MTSSLVGSEMCIRDRVPALLATRQTVDQSAPLGGSSNTALQFVSVPEPVSYTHLTLPTICSV
eukprot:12162377-Prorocentrum_lima.AAC.1